MSVAMTGSASKICQQLAQGLLIYFEQLSKEGCIYSVKSKVGLAVKEDVYETSHRVNNILTLFIIKSTYIFCCLVTLTRMF